MCWEHLHGDEYLEAGSDRGPVGQTMDGASMKTLGTQNSAVALASDGANWQLVGAIGTVG